LFAGGYNLLKLEVCAKKLRINAAHTLPIQCGGVFKTAANLAWRVKTKWMLARGRQNSAPTAKTSFKILNSVQKKLSGILL
jgi:hypothetical protein